MTIVNHWLSLIITDYHWLSLIIIDYHWLSLIIIGHHWLSLIVWKSENITYPLTGLLTTWNQEMLAHLKKPSNVENKPLTLRCWRWSSAGKNWRERTGASKSFRQLPNFQLIENMKCSTDRNLHAYHYIRLVKNNSNPF